MNFHITAKRKMTATRNRICRWLFSLGQILPTVASSLSFRTLCKVCPIFLELLPNWRTKPLPLRKNRYPMGTWVYVAVILYAVRFFAILSGGRKIKQTIPKNSQFTPFALSCSAYGTLRKLNLWPPPWLSNLVPGVKPRRMALVLGWVTVLYCLMQNYFNFRSQCSYHTNRNNFSFRETNSFNCRVRLSAFGNHHVYSVKLFKFIRL